MARSPYSRVSYQFGPGPVTPAVKALLIANGVAFLMQVLLPSVTTVGGLTPAAVIESLWLWQPFTYMFLHAGLLHLGGNMLFLWIFGNNVEDVMGRARFVAFYLLGGIAALGLQVAIGPNSDVPTIGASGAIAAVLGAYLLTFPRARVLTVIFIVFFFNIIFKITSWKHFLFFFLFLFAKIFFLFFLLFFIIIIFVFIVVLIIIIFLVHWSMI